MMSLDVKARFTWLHLTDLHVGIGTQDWLWPSLKHEFFRDIGRVHTLSGPWDTVIFSGDLTQKGTRGEFDRLDEILFELWDHFAKLGFNPSLITLPGNHDLQRPTLNAQYRTLKRWWTEPDIHEEFFCNSTSEYRTAIAVVFKEYSDWLQRDTLKRHLPGTQGLLAGDQSYITEKEGLKIGIVTLNSTWLQLDDADYVEKLYVSPRQLLEITGADPEKWCRKNSFNLLASHHPIGWLAKKSQEQWNSEIYPPGRFAAHIFGHMHEASTMSTALGGSLARISIQGASMFGLANVSDTSERIHGYSIGTVDLSSPAPEIRIWPRRLHKVQSGANSLGPDVSFTLDSDSSFAHPIAKPSPLWSGEQIGTNTATATLQQIPLDGQTPSEALLRLRHHLSPAPAHANVRRIEQSQAAKALAEMRAVWVVAEWGMGEEGFLAGLRKSLRTTSPIFRLDLSDYTDRASLFASIELNLGCSFERLCQLMADVGDCWLFFDNIPAAISTSANSAEDLEELIKVIIDYCPNIRLVLKTRRAPARPTWPLVQLHSLDEADLRTYVSDHEGGSSSLTTEQSVGLLHRHTDGLPTRIDRALKELEVVSLSELISSNTDLASGAGTDEIPAALQAAIRALADSADPRLRRSFELLKVLSLFPRGEMLSRVRHFKIAAPFFPNHATELLEQGFIEINSAQILVSGDGNESGKILVVPRLIRECVMDMINADEFKALNHRAVDLYFGPGALAGIFKPPPSYPFHKPLCSNSDIANASTIIVRLLREVCSSIDEALTTRTLGLATLYLSALHQGSHYQA